MNRKRRAFHRVVKNSPSGNLALLSHISPSYAHFNYAHVVAVLRQTVYIRTTGAPLYKSRAAVGGNELAAYCSSKRDAPLTGTIKASDNSKLSTTGWETRVELIMQLRCNINRPIRVGVCNVRLKEASARSRIRSRKRGCWWWCAPLMSASRGVQNDLIDPSAPMNTL